MKKLYKNTLMQLILALCVFSFAACQEYGIDSQPEGPAKMQIDAMETYTALATSPTNIVFNISSNTPWTITSDQQWCKPDPAMSAASSLVSEVSVALESNTTGKQRVAKLTITAEGVSESKVITITQVSKEDLVVIPYDEIVPTKGGQLSFNIVSNKPWKIIPSTQFLENIDKVSGAGNENEEKETVTITVPENTGAVRNGKITVKTDFQEYSFTITQDGIVIAPENEEEAVNTLNSVGGEKTIKINSSIEWIVKVPEEYAGWLNAEANGENLTLKATFNNLFINRVGHVLLFPKKNVPGFVGVPVEVKQTRNIWLNGSEESIDPVTGYATVKSTEKNRYATNFYFKKGRLIWTFDNVSMPSSSAYIDFNFDTWWGPAQGAGWIHGWLRPASSKQNSEFQANAAWPWSEAAWKIEDMDAIKTIEISVLDDVNHPGKLCIRLLINEKEVVKFEDRNNIYTDAPQTHKGQQIYFGFEQGADPVCSLTFKSFDYIPAE